MTARRRFELPSYGIDEFRQLNGSDPFGSNSWLGLRVPKMSTAAIAAANSAPGKPSPPFSNRFLFMGSTFSVGEGSLARVIGYRQLIEIGFLPTVGGETPGATGPRPVILQVTTPGFAFTDATVSFHFRRLGPPGKLGFSPDTPAPQNLKCLARRYSSTPALLYETITLPAGDAFYVDLTAYTPPALGKPWGTPLTDDPRLSTVYGLQTDWKTPDAFGSLDAEVRGPETVAAFISVAQTDTSRPELVSAAPAAYGIGISPEDAFIQTAQDIYGVLPSYWRVAVSLIVETDSIVSEVRSTIGEEGKM